MYSYIYDYTYIATANRHTFTIKSVGNVLFSYKKCGKVWVNTFKVISETDIMKKHLLGIFALLLLPLFLMGSVKTGEKDLRISFIYSVSSG